jgi:DNA-binding NarL/FixJ family response regulator
VRGLQEPRHAPLILCCEDEAALRRDIADELVEAGYRVCEAADGVAAWEAISVQRPDMILCDITMPRLGGHGLLERLLRERPDLADVPFLFLTALSAPRDVIEGKRAGADDYLVKPIDYDLLLATIAARLRQVARWHDQLAVQIEATRAAITQPVGAAAHAVLDRLTIGIVLLDAQAQVLHANPAARQLVHGDMGGGLLHGPVADSALRCAVHAAIAAALAGLDHAEALALPGSDGSRGLILMISALPAAPKPERGPTSSQAQVPDGPVVMITLIDPERRGLPSAAALSRLFALTATEATMARLLVQGLRRQQIAAEMQVSHTTVAFHLRNVFLKTGTNRQADLVALLLCAPAIEIK